MNENIISWNTRKQWALQLASGLAYLHSNNIVHNDVKSLNVLLDKELRAKWTDFGLAGTKNATSTLKSSASLEFQGSFNWLAPEQVGNPNQRTRAADIYSFGLVLLETITRKVPRANLSQPLIYCALKAKQKEPIPAETIPEFKLILESCWKDNPRQRPTASAIVQYLQGNRLAITNNSPAQHEHITSSQSSNYQIQQKEIQQPVLQQVPSFNQQVPSFGKQAPNFNVSEHEQVPKFNQLIPHFNQQPQQTPHFNQQPQQTPHFYQQPQQIPHFNQQPQQIPHFNQQPQQMAQFNQQIPNFENINNLGKQHKFLHYSPTNNQYQHNDVQFTHDSRPAFASSVETRRKEPIDIKNNTQAASSQKFQTTSNNKYNSTSNNEKVAKRRPLGAKLTSSVPTTTTSTATTTTTTTSTTQQLTSTSTNSVLDNPHYYYNYNAIHQSTPAANVVKHKLSKTGHKLMKSILQNTCNVGVLNNDHASKCYNNLASINWDSLNITKMLNPELEKNYVAKRSLIANRTAKNNSKAHVFKLSQLNSATLQLSTTFLTDTSYHKNKRVNEVYLFYATTQSKANEIFSNGFDVNCKTKHGLYGSGIYFAESFCKADHCATKANNDRRASQFIIVAKVCLGACLVSSEFRANERWAPLFNYSGVYCDSLVGVALASHLEIVLFSGSLALPVYLIEYNTTSSF